MNPHDPHFDPSSASSPADQERTTNDVRSEAEEALRLFAAFQETTRPLDKPQSGVFELGMLLRVEVQGSDAPLLVIPQRETVIGRADPGSSDVPEIDLTRYAAYQMGISRRHAILRWDENQLLLIDLGSRNGTYVNGKKAQPHQPFKLYDGDEMRLGKMLLRIYFRRR